MTDITVQSRVLDRDIPVRVVAPTNVPEGAVLPVVYLLHGAGESYRTWTENSNIASLASRGVILVMPDAARTYYVNDNTGYRYEDFFITELMPAIDREFHYAARDRAHTAIVGNSRGGYAAALYALKHLELFSYVVGLSSAFDLADRSFRWHAPLDSYNYNKVFGPPGSPIRVANDPFLFAHSIARERAPYFDLICGDRDSLLSANQRFAAELEASHLPHNFATVSGGHNWGTWNAQLPRLQSDLLAHFHIASDPHPGPATP